MTKKIISLTAFLIMTGTVLFGQSLKFGLKAGADIHKLSGKSFKEEFSFGYHIGAFAEVGLTSKIHVQPEVYFSQVNADSSKNFSSVYNFNKIPKLKFSYLNIPVLLNIKPNKFFAFQLGPQFGILLGQKNNLVQNGKDAFKKGDVSAVGGLQVNILKFRAYARYVVGLSDLNDLDDREAWKNQTIHIGVGISL